MLFAAWDKAMREKRFERTLGEGMKMDSRDWMRLAFAEAYKAALPQWIKASDVPKEWKDGKDRLVYVDECRSIAYWGKTAHVPLYGWMDPTTWNGDGCDLMDPQPEFVCLLPSGPVE